MQRLTSAFAAQRVTVAGNPAAHTPELVLVLEIAGEMDNFVRAARRVPGLEFLAEEIADKLDPDDFAMVDRDGNRKAYGRQLFLVASDQQAWAELLRLWGLFKQGATFPYGLTKFRDLFSVLREVRPWDDRDRLERTGAAEAWSREMSGLNSELVEFEVELWLRSDPARRREAVTLLEGELKAAGGMLLTELVLEDISYHGILGRVPANRLMDAVARREVRWLSTGAVRFFHAVGQLAAPIVAPDQLGQAQPQPSPPAAGSPRLAVLDGLPIAGHILLADRLELDDPENWEQTIPANRRRHGTGMTSIVVHGDVASGGRSLTERIYVRPILSPQAPSWVQNPAEELPRDRLPVDMLQSAVARLFEGEAVAPTARVVVLAVGDAAQQFSQFVSPLARLLDWLSFRHRVLFVVSAGNHLGSVPLDAAIDLADPAQVQHGVLCALARDAALRRLLAPAESVNALTVGAAHSDDSGALPQDDRIDTMMTGDLPNYGSAWGAGHRRAVKPDVLLPGGRQLVRAEPALPDGSIPLSVPTSDRPPGIEMASPGRQAGVLDATSHGSGTSVATALAGHHAGHLFTELDNQRLLYGADFPDATFDDVLIKAAIAHTASWGTARSAIDQAQDALGLSRSRDAVARAAGYGLAEPDQAFRCDDHRVTVIGAGVIARDDADAYSFPLPPSLASVTDRRRLTLTLAWLTPINPQHRFYRRAALKLEAIGNHVDVFGSRTEAEMNMARRGTLQHEILEGTAAVPFATGSSVEFVVSCRADAGALEAAVPYAVFVTIEVPTGVNVRLYNEVRQGLRTPVSVRPRQRT